jgi:hypothetical protein
MGIRAAKIRSIALAAFFFLSLSADLGAESLAFLESEPRFKELGSLPEPISLKDLEDMALLASGVKSEALGSYEERLAKLFASLRGEVGSISDAAAKGEAVLAFLHRGPLKAYKEDATTLDGLLDTGLYNCVSSAVLYALAARSLGLEVEGARTSDHAFCVLVVKGRRIDVETTNRYGFDPGEKKEFKDSFGQATGYAYVAPGGYGDRRSSSAKELVGLILSNRASKLERSGSFAQAVQLGSDYVALCPGDETRAFFADRINNYIADLASRRDYSGAESAAIAAAEALPSEKKLAVLAKTASYNRAAAMAQAGDWAGAFDRATSLLAAPKDSTAKALSELASNSLMNLALKDARKGDYASARTAVADRALRAEAQAVKAAYAAIGDMELVKAANELPFAEALAAAERLLGSGEVDWARYAQAALTFYGREAARLGNSGDWLGSAALADEGASRLADGKLGDAKVSATQARELKRVAQTMRRNYAVEAHNRFASLYNAGKYTEAQAVIEEALISLPGDENLARDLATAEDAAAAAAKKR